jgi:hypothetical protein
MKSKKQDNNGLLIDGINALNHQQPKGKRIRVKSQKGKQVDLIKWVVVCADQVMLYSS